MQTGMLIVCFAALIVAVVVSIRFSVNVGIVAYALAFLVGGFGLGLPANTIVGYFPVSLFFQLMVITLFYGFAVSNGTMQKIADNAVFLCRNRSALVPWVIFLVAFALCAIGCPPPGIGAALVALSVAVQKRTGMKYYMAISFSTFGAMAGGFMPLGLFSTITKGVIINVGGAEPAAAAAMMSKISLFMVLFELACAIAVYIWGGGYRTVKLDFAKPEPFTKKQRQTLIIIAAVLVLLVVPAVLKPVIPFFKTFTSYVSIISLSCIGALLCSALKLADEREVIRKNIPWSLLFMIAGVVSLINVMNQAGLTEFLSGMFTEGMGTVVEALLPGDLDSLTEPGHIEGDLGYCLLPNGAGYGSVFCALPEVTLDMYKWYKQLRMVDKLSYKIWYPGSHISEINGVTVEDDGSPLHL